MWVKDAEKFEKVITRKSLKKKKETTKNKFRKWKKRVKKKLTLVTQTFKYRCYINNNWRKRRRRFNNK